ncbi:MAG: hypothetical protein IKA90_06085, partial [Clostridia bacterium]|nr:hypothetical protein [Clostridia bacterium]
MKNLYEQWEIKVLRARIIDKQSYDKIVEGLTEVFPDLSKREIAQKVKNLIAEFNQRMIEVAENNPKTPDNTVQKTLDGQDAKGQP